MSDGMNFDKYIDNPSGGSYISNRNMYKQMYKNKFDAILLRENGKIEYKIYLDNEDYYIYMKIPSEVISDFYYDVVIRLFTTENRKKSNANLREYAVEFFSNDPSFVYTFAYSFKKNKLLIKDLESKLGNDALKNAAKIKNPKNEVWYVKSLFFAYLTMERYHLFNRNILKHNSVKYDKKELLSKIMYAPEKISLRQEAQQKLTKDKQKEKREKDNRNYGSKSVKVSNGITKTKVSKTSKISSKVKTANVIKPKR